MAVCKGHSFNSGSSRKASKAGIERLICAAPMLMMFMKMKLLQGWPFVGSDNLECTPATGRVNMKVSRRGLVRYERALISSINEVDERITLHWFNITTFGPWTDGGNAEIIPFLSRSSLRQIENLLSGLPAFGFHPLNTADVALIQTRIPVRLIDYLLPLNKSQQIGLQCWDAT